MNLKILGGGKTKMKSKIKPKVTDKKIKKEVKLKIQEETPIELPIRRRFLDGDINEFNRIANSCKDNELLTYEIHVVIDDAIKRMLNVRKDHSV